MNVLSVSTDRKVFEKGSAVRTRLIEYGQLVDELHVIVFAKRSLGLKDEKIASNIFIYPTNSYSRFSHICAAVSRARALKQNGITTDLVTTQDPFESGIAGLRITKIFGARLHVQVHTDFMSKYFSRESMLNCLRVTVAKFILRRVDGVRVVSKRIRKSIEKFIHPGIPIAVLPIFVEQHDEQVVTVRDLRKKYPQFDFRALVVARLAPEKNIKSAIIAVSSIIKCKPNTGLVIVGDGPERTRLEKLAAQLGITENVIFEGWQDNIFSYYKTADVLVFPSLYEGYGMAAVEAALAGCPVVMTDVGCAGDVILDGQNGLVAPAGNTKALVGALARIVSGELKFAVKSLQLPTKQEYLAAYKKSWQDSLV
jgi:glycosyltransferase involved in cell wall biosynthesis